MKQRYIELLSSIERPGMKELLDWMENKSDFFTAPASTQYHGACEGGLLEHSLAVYDQLCVIADTHKNALPTVYNSTLILAALLHDICKANFYTVSTRNVKNEETGQWEKKPFYKIEDKFPYGHGEKSVFIAKEFIELTVEETMAIRWHMGAFGAESYAERQTLSAAMDRFPMILALQMADLAASYFDKK